MTPRTSGSRVHSNVITILAFMTLTLPVRAAAADRHMSLVGTLAPWEGGEYSNVAADASRGVAYLGSFDDQGVAVIDMRDRSHPVMTDHLSTHIHDGARTAIVAPDATSTPMDGAHLEGTSDSADLDLVGRFLAVSHQDLTFTDPPIGFEGISVYDTGPDPFHPVLLRRIEIPGGVHTVQIDPEVENGRPYAYCNSAGNWKMTVVDILTGAILSQYASSEGIGCTPSPSFCAGFNFAHEGFIQRHPRSGRVLDYVSYWDSGLRIVDVTDPSHPVEVGAFDYNIFTNRLRAAHYAAPTPSGDWLYLEDEIGFFQAGGVHILDTRACDGTSNCTPVLVGGWDLPGRDMQTASIHKFFHHPNFNGSSIPISNRSFIYDAHNLDRLGENTLLVANYGMGIRMIDTSVKSAPVEVAFFLPNSNRDDACKVDCGIMQRQTWGSYFGSDGLVYASDLSLGFFIVDPAGRSGGAAAASYTRASDRTVVSAAPALRVRRAGGSYTIAFTTGSCASRASVHDAAGRTVAHLVRPGSDDGCALRWNGRDDAGAKVARGIYLVRAESGDATATTKIVHLGD